MAVSDILHKFMKRPIKILYLIFQRLNLSQQRKQTNQLNVHITGLKFPIYLLQYQFKLTNIAF